MAVLAPMAGYSDAPMRRLCAEAGAAWTVSEMLSARGLLADEGRAHEIGAPYPGEPRRVVQLFGADPDELAAGAARAAEVFGPAAIDLNMGCPVPKLRGRGGACLLQTPDLAARIVRAMRGAVKLDVSAKIRLGFDHDRSLELGLALQEAGADLITVHGRTAAQRYRGEADWAAIARLAAALRVPVVGSGDVTDLQTLRERQRSGVAAVMVGRGAVGNPWLFREARGGPAPTPAEREAVALRHAELACALYGERRAMLELRKVLPRYFLGLPDARRRALQQLGTLAGLREWLAASTDPPAAPTYPPAVPTMAPA